MSKKHCHPAPKTTFFRPFATLQVLLQPQNSTTSFPGKQATRFQAKTSPTLSPHSLPAGAGQPRPGTRPGTRARPRSVLVLGLVQDLGAPSRVRAVWRGARSFGKQCSSFGWLGVNWEKRFVGLPEGIEVVAQVRLVRLALGKVGFTGIGSF